jgi:hypothetical protein
MGMAVAFDRLRRHSRRGQDWGWFLRVKRGTALSAKIVRGPELYQVAAVAAQYLS